MLSISNAIRQLTLIYAVTDNREKREALNMAMDALRRNCALDQTKWERNMAFEQLEANGLRFGHKDDYGWIPCKERMPEDDERYKDKRVINCLVTTDGGIVTKVQRCQNDFDDHWHWGRISKGVKAWRPLPERYVEQKGANR